MTDRVLALLDGTLADPEAPLLRADDLGVLRGDGVFETVLVVDGAPRELEPHLDRLARSAAMLDLPEPDRAAWHRCTEAVIGAWRGGREMVLRLVLTRGVEGDPTGTVTGYATGTPLSPRHAEQRRTGVAAVTLTRGFAPELAEPAPWLLLGAKTLSYAVNMAAVRHAERRGADEVVFTATGGAVLEGPTSSVVVANDRTLRTPPPSQGILPGTTQAALFRAAENAGWQTKVEPLEVSELLAADGLWLTSSVRLVTRVHTLNGVPLPDSGLTTELAALIDAPAG